MHALATIAIIFAATVTTIASYELGHYTAARILCRLVRAFSFGLGHRLAARREKHGTLWRLALLPMGDYVALHTRAPPGPPNRQWQRAPAS